MPDQQPEMRQYAHGYAERQLKVIPCKGKVPRTMHGLKDASDHPAAIERWWGMWPSADVGLVTGRESGLIVLDIDPDKGGEESLAALQQQHGRLPFTVQVITGSGGTHYWFKAPGVAIPNSVGRLGDGLDVRGEGGYVIAPPSLHVSGQRYRFEMGHELWGYEPGHGLAEMPEWLIGLMLGKGGRQHSVGLEAGEPVGEGQRHDFLVRVAGSLRRYGASPAMIERTLSEFNLHRCQPPLDDDEVRQIAYSMDTYEPAVLKELFPARKEHPPPAPAREIVLRWEDSDQRQAELGYLEDRASQSETREDAMAAKVNAIVALHRSEEWQGVVSILLALAYIIEDRIERKQIEHGKAGIPIHLWEVCNWCGRSTGHTERVRDVLHDLRDRQLLSLEEPKRQRDQHGRGYYYPPIAIWPRPELRTVDGFLQAVLNAPPNPSKQAAKLRVHGKESKSPMVLFPPYPVFRRNRTS